MIYLSKLLNQKVWDAFGHVVGKLDEILVNHTEQSMPPVKALVVKTGKGQSLNVDGRYIATLWPSITLNADVSRLQAYLASGHELPLRGRVLDQQIVDTEGKRLVRVNDVQIARKDNGFYLTGVDASSSGLLRRLGLENLGKNLAKTFGKDLITHVIPWEDVASIEHDDPLRLRVSQDKLVQMPPADIASILDDLDHHTRGALLQGFADEDLADTLEESSAEVQQAVLSSLNPERAADVLEEMDPDEAADILADMEDSKSEELLRLMEDEDEEEMRALLGYPEHSAGGIMTTEFASAPVHFNVEQTLGHLRTDEDAQEDEFMFYVYILDEAEKLLGVISLRDLVTSPLNTPLANWCDEDLVKVVPTAPQNEVAYLVAKYDLMAVPVIDAESQKMLGIVTVDDALDTVLPTAWKKKLPRFAGR